MTAVIFLRLVHLTLVKPSRQELGRLTDPGTGRSEADNPADYIQISAKARGVDIVRVCPPENHSRLTFERFARPLRVL